MKSFLQKKLGSADGAKVAPEDLEASSVASIRTQIVNAGVAVAGVAKEKGVAATGMAVNTAAAAAGNVAVMARDVAFEQANTAAVAAGNVAARARDVAAEHRQKAYNFVLNVRELIEAWVKQRILASTERLVDRMPGLAKNVLEDPDMPRWVSKGKDRILDAAWPDVRTEIMWEIAVLLDRDATKDEPTRQGVDCFRAFFRYHLFPYDKTFWGKLRDPVHVLCLLLPLTPVWGVTPVWFLFIFLIIDKTDEFQLVQFILSFKGMAFLSQGIFRGLLGFVLFINCVSAPAKLEHSCKTDGPGAGFEIWPVFGGFVVQVLMVWLAFALLRCARENGRSQLKGNIVVKEEGHMVTKGGLLIYFLWYDLFTFSISVGVIVYAVFTRPKPDVDDWPVHHIIFAAQVLYGYLSMPFFLFTLPLLRQLLTHSLPTAYDRRGRCRKPASPARTEEAKPQPVPSCTETELDHLMAKIKNLMPSFSSNGSDAAEDL